jgi:hypothetical protein
VNARACEWCGRSFVAEYRQRSILWLVPVVGVLLGMLSVLLVAVAFANLRSSPPARATEQPPMSAVQPVIEEIEPLPTVEPTLAPAIPPPTAVPTPVPTDAPTVQPTSPPATPEFVRIANTGGTGAFIRREPRAGAPGIVAYRDGTVLRIAGADTTVDGRVWRQVEDQRGTRGWTPQEYLVPSSTGF